MEQPFIHRLNIRNFGIIREAVVDIRAVNVLIGEQSSGKSLIAKLVYFFKSISTRFLVTSLTKTNVEDMQNLIAKRFSTFFPRYLWDTTPFEINYLVGEAWLKVSYSPDETRSDQFRVEFSESLINDFLSEERTYQTSITDIFSQAVDDGVHTELLRKLEEEYPSFFGRFTFIPAGRSAFSLLNANIYSFLSEGVKIDPFIQEYGVALSRTKSKFAYTFPFSTPYRYKKLLARIIKGNYKHDTTRSEDWIIDDKGVERLLQDSSSGQQEVVPLILSLLTESFHIKSTQQKGMLFIEEPEAHLFPTSQYDLVSFMSACNIELGANLFITTHSPYIISAFNNLIIANDLVKTGKISDQQFCELNDGGVSIPFDNVSAYTINNGVAESIIDEEYRLIGAYSLDDISNHTQEVLNNLLMLQGQK